MTKKLHITLELPDDVAARLRESFTGERLKYETHRSIEDIALPRERRPRPPRISTVVLFLGLFAAGAMMGYAATGGLAAVFALVDQWTSTWAPGSGGTASPQRQAPVAAAPRPAVVVPAQPAPPAPPRAQVGPTPSAPPIHSVSPVTYRVQVGAFRQRPNADVLITALRKDGFSAYTTLKAGLHVVQVGTFSDRTNAEALAKQLRTHRYDVFIVQEGTSRGR